MCLLGCSTKNDDALVIATSANMQYTLENIVNHFENLHPENIEIVIGSSGKLNAQIEQGAPFDVFVSANSKYPERLFEQRLAEKPFTYAYGKLILWTMREKAYSLFDLSSSSVSKIGVPNPKTAPYGESAVELLINSGVYEKVKEKLVFGESISQVNHFITSGSVDVGFTSLSVVYSDNLKNKGNWVIMDDENYAPIEQKVCILSNSLHLDEAKTFLNYLLSEDARKIIKEYGYNVPVK